MVMGWMTDQYDEWDAHILSTGKWRRCTQSEATRWRDSWQQLRDRVHVVRATDDSASGDKLPSDASNAAREVGTSAQLPTFSSRLASHRAKAEAATPGPWYQMRGDEGVVCAGLYKAATEVCEASLRDAAHIAANDPATVLALLDVVEAARLAAGADINYPMGAVYHDRLKAALDRLKEVLR